MSTDQGTTELNSLVREHEDLRAMIEADRAWWQEIRELGVPRFWEMASRLTALRVRLAEHFSREEAAERCALKQRESPAWADKVAMMAQEHEHFLQRLDSIISRANACGGYECWGEIGLEFSELNRAIDEHESEELEMLRKSLEKAAVGTGP